jgi:hypothetical protein
VVAPRIAQVVDDAWFANIDARSVDILSVDYREIIADHQRVLLLWDAHGFEIAELVLGEILPRLVDRAHLLLLHDISDNRYAAVPRSYGGHPLWKGNKWQQADAGASRVNIGWMNSVEDQVIALADFSARNDVEIGSAIMNTLTSCPPFMRRRCDEVWVKNRSRRRPLGVPLAGWQGRAVSFSRPERLAGGEPSMRHRDRSAVATPCDHRHRGDALGLCRDVGLATLGESAFTRTDVDPLPPRR